MAHEKGKFQNWNKPPRHTSTRHSGAHTLRGTEPTTSFRVYDVGTALQWRVGARAGPVRKTRIRATHYVADVHTYHYYAVLHTRPSLTSQLRAREGKKPKFASQFWGSDKPYWTVLNRDQGDTAVPGTEPTTSFRHHDLEVTQHGWQNARPPAPR
jgi:hypothetical protein